MKYVRLISSIGLISTGLYSYYESWVGYYTPDEIGVMFGTCMVLLGLIHISEALEK
jgi:hypothetical protein